MKRKIFARSTGLILILSFIASVAVLGTFSVSAANEPNPFTKVNLIDLCYVNGNSGSWSYNIEPDGTVILKSTVGETTNNNAIALSDVVLEKDKDYTIEMKVRFAEGYEGAETTGSRAGGFLFGSFGENPWATGGGSYCAMFDRGHALPIRIFGKKITGGTSVEKNCSSTVDTSALAKTDWVTVRVTITAAGTMMLYMDGKQIGVPSDESATYNGGALGLIVYGVKTKVEFKDLCYVDRVTTEEAFFAVSNESHNLTIKYIYADGTQAAPDVVQSVFKGNYYSVNSPVIEGYTESISTIKGLMESADITLTVTYNASRSLKIIYQKADSSKVFDDYIQTGLVKGDKYSVKSRAILFYNADVEVVTGTVEDEDVVVIVTYSPVTFKLTVQYVFEDGTQAAPEYTEEYEYNASYSVASHAIEGYTPNKTEVSGNKLSKDTVVKVIYIANEVEVEDTTESPTTKSGCKNSVASAFVTFTTLFGMGCAVFTKKKS